MEMAERLINAIQVVNVDTGMSYIRHMECVSADEVITSTSVEYPTERKTPFICGHCEKEISFHQTRIHRKEVAEPTGQGMRGESKRR